MKCLVDAGLPKGVLSVVFGVPAFVSTHLISSPIIRAVHFTGSVPVGKQLMKLAAEGMKRTTMELGGHGPVLVFDDVDLDQVLDLSVGAKYRNSGQVCVSPTRYYVHESIYQKFVEGFAARAKNWKRGRRPRGRRRRWGRWRIRVASQAMDMFIEDARSHGGKVGAGGSTTKVDGKPNGFYFSPTVLSDVPEVGAHHERRAVRAGRDHQSVRGFRFGDHRRRIACRTGWRRMRSRSRRSG